MIATLGQSALLFAWLMSIVPLCCSLLRRFGGEYRAAKLAESAVLLQWMGIASAFLLLIYANVVSDFSVLSVAEHSHTQKPLLYKIAGAWGYHEGSMLLWSTLLATITLAFSYASAFPLPMTTRILTIQSLLQTGFLSFVIFTSTPFVYLSPSPAEGNGLNPLLQDVGLATHPPCLYLGYVGFSVLFSACIAGLFSGGLTKEWARIMRPWTLFAWSMLTLGITLGSWWAYRELGWGGFWFWDPVENASLMPWLSATALVHLLTTLATRDRYREGTALLAILTFALSLLGTFLVRSGVLTSVHAFASDPTRGVWMLVLLGITLLSGLTVFAISTLRNVSPPAPEKAFLSRETMMLLQALFVVSLCFTVMLGTLYPLGYALISKRALSVGAPYFAATFVPLALPVLCLAGLSGFIAWQRDTAKHVLKHMRLPAALSLLMAVFYAVYAPEVSVFGFVTALAILWLIVASLSVLLRYRPKHFLSLEGLTAWRKAIPAKTLGMVMAHAGIGFLSLGIWAASFYGTQQEARFTEGKTVSFAQYKWRLDNVTYGTGPNYLWQKATLSVLDSNGNEITRLFPERRVYPYERSETAEAAIASSLTRDLYAAIQPGPTNDVIDARLYIRPGMMILWGGALIMVAGGFVAAFRRTT